MVLLNLDPKINNIFIVNTQLVFLHLFQCSICVLDYLIFFPICKQSRFHLHNPWECHDYLDYISFQIQRQNFSKWFPKFKKSSFWFTSEVKKRNFKNSSFWNCLHMFNLIYSVETKFYYSSKLPVMRYCSKLFFLYELAMKLTRQLQKIKTFIFFYSNCLVKIPVISQIFNLFKPMLYYYMIIQRQLVYTYTDM